MAYNSGGAEISELEGLKRRLPLSKIIGRHDVDLDARREREKALACSSRTAAGTGDRDTGI